MVKNTRHGFLFVCSSALIWFCRRHPCFFFFPATIMSRTFVLRALWVHHLIRYNPPTTEDNTQIRPACSLSFVLFSCALCVLLLSFPAPHTITGLLRLVESLLVTPTYAFLHFYAAFLSKCSPLNLNPHLIVFGTSSSSFDVPTPDTPISPLVFVPLFVQLSTLASVLRSLDWALTLARLSVASSAK
jgi:hypothetical protein